MKVVVFDFVNHFGGAQRSTVQVLGWARGAVDAVVLDAFGGVPEYGQYARMAGLGYRVLLPDPVVDTIGHRGRPLRRFARAVRALPDLLKVARRLHEYLVQ